MGMSELWWNDELYQRREERGIVGSRCADRAGGCERRTDRRVLTVLPPIFPGPWVDEATMVVGGSPLSAAVVGQH